MNRNTSDRRPANRQSWSDKDTYTSKTTRSSKSTEIYRHLERKKNRISIISALRKRIGIRFQKNLLSYLEPKHGSETDLDLDLGSSERGIGRGKKGGREKQI